MECVTSHGSTATFGPGLRTSAILCNSQRSSYSQSSKGSGSTFPSTDKESASDHSESIEPPASSQSTTSLKAKLGLSKKGYFYNVGKGKQSSTEVTRSSQQASTTAKISRSYTTPYDSPVTHFDPVPSSADAVASCPVTPTTRSFSIPTFPSYTSLSASSNQAQAHAPLEMVNSFQSLFLGEDPDSVPSTPLHQTSFFGVHDRSPSGTSFNTSFDSTQSPSLLSSMCAISPSLSVSSANTVPDHLAWLKTTTVELLIDQEGFRAIRPSFRFVAYSPRSRAFSTLSPGNEVYHDSADFMPSTRQVFHFHYVPFDSGHPTLRRVMVNNDESRDHITRQASLTMKSNSVYVIRGSEQPTSLANSHGASAISSGAPAETSKLRWRFEYRISDRHLDTGRFIEGEKTFIPLTFSCSPMLLHSLQGKKMRLMHVVKKSVVPNLVAEKMDPPRPPPMSSQPSSPAEQLQSPLGSPTNVRADSASGVPLAKPFAFDAERRNPVSSPTADRPQALRNVHRTSTEPDSPIAKPLFFNIGLGKFPQMTSEMRLGDPSPPVDDPKTSQTPGRVRRASVAGEYSGGRSSSAKKNRGSLQVARSPPLPALGLHGREDEERENETSPKAQVRTSPERSRVDRQIVAPSKLIEMMNDAEKTPPMSVEPGLRPPPCSTKRSM